MPRYILIPASGAEAELPVFTTAFAVARTWAGHLKFLHVRADVDAILMSIAGVDMMTTTQIAARLEQEIAERERQAERRVRAFCARKEVYLDDAPGSNRVSAEWKVETGDEERWLARHGRVADLIVVGCICDGERMSMHLLEVALIQTGRPVLLHAAKIAAGDDPYDDTLVHHRNVAKTTVAHQPQRLNRGCARWHGFSVSRHHVSHRRGPRVARDGEATHRVAASEDAK